LASSILATASARFALLRTLTFLNRDVTVSPYDFDLATLVDRAAQLVNRLGMCGVKDEGLTDPSQFGNTTNIIPLDNNGRVSSRTAREVLRVLYGTGNATAPGGVYPRGANGKIADQNFRLRLN
ncbi:desiccation-related protein PCC13-62-like protein, partial [Corchorus capsularis]